MITSVFCECAGLAFRPAEGGVGSDTPESHNAAVEDGRKLQATTCYRSKIYDITRFRLQPETHVSHWGG